MNKADAKHTPIAKHPGLLLETFLCHLGHTVFPNGKENPEHPVLVVDRYVSLGSEVRLCFRRSILDVSMCYSVLY